MGVPWDSPGPGPWGGCPAPCMGPSPGPGKGFARGALKFASTLRRLAVSLLPPAAVSAEATPAEPGVWASITRKIRNPVLYRARTEGSECTSKGVLQTVVFTVVFR